MYFPHASHRIRSYLVAYGLEAATTSTPESTSLSKPTFCISSAAFPSNTGDRSLQLLSKLGKQPGSRLRSLQGSGWIEGRGLGASGTEGGGQVVSGMSAEALLLVISVE